MIFFSIMMPVTWTVLYGAATVAQGIIAKHWAPAEFQVLLFLPMKTSMNKKYRVPVFKTILPYWG